MALKAENEGLNILSELPSEVVLNEILTRLDFKSFVNYCSLTKINARKCEDINFWRYLKIDHRDFQDLLLYLAYTDETKLFRVLVINSDKIKKMIDERTLNRAVIYFAEKGNEEMEKFAAKTIPAFTQKPRKLVHPKIRTESAKTLVTTIKQIGEKGEKCFNKKYTTIQDSWIYISRSLNDYDYLPDLVVNNLPLSNYKWIFECAVSPSYLYVPRELTMALMRKSERTGDLEDVMKVKTIWEGVGTEVGYYLTTAIVSSGTLEHVNQFVPTDKLYEYLELMYPPVDERIFYAGALQLKSLTEGGIENVGGAKLAVAFFVNHKLLGILSGGYMSTDPYEWIDFVEQHIKNEEDKQKVYSMSVVSAKNAGYNYWSFTVLTHPKNKRSVIEF